MFGTVAIIGILCWLIGFGVYRIHIERRSFTEHLIDQIREELSDCTALKQLIEATENHVSATLDPHTLRELAWELEEQFVAYEQRSKDRLRDIQQMMEENNQGYLPTIPKKYMARIESLIRTSKLLADKNREDAHRIWIHANEMVKVL